MSWAPPFLARGQSPKLGCGSVLSRIPNGACRQIVRDHICGHCYWGGSARDRSGHICPICKNHHGALRCMKHDYRLHGAQANGGSREESQALPGSHKSHVFRRLQIGGFPIAGHRIIARGSGALVRSAGAWRGDDPCLMMLASS